MAIFRKTYEYNWRNDEDLIELFTAFSRRINLRSEELKLEGVSTDLLFLSLIKLYQEWHNLCQGQDFLLFNVLSAAAACKWLYDDDEEKFIDLYEMMDEIHKKNDPNKENLLKQFVTKAASLFSHA